VAALGDVDAGVVGRADGWLRDGVGTARAGVEPVRTGAGVVVIGWVVSSEAAVEGFETAGITCVAVLSTEAVSFSLLAAPSLAAVGDETSASRSGSDSGSSSKMDRP
jgi:hypothetical protein